jgi:hypothetical protein
VTKDRQVPVIIKSTFRDIHAERNQLVTVVFPEFHEQLELEFLDVDLRWGYRSWTPTPRVSRV